jgi:segregation and condensation protein B
LIAQGFVRKRRPAEGRSPMVQVTDKFYQHFEIDQLPKLRPKAAAPAQPEEEGAVESQIGGET